MPHKSYQEESRKNYGQTIPESQGISDDQIKIGCLQRIATACESMAKHHDHLVKDRDFYKRLSERREVEQRAAERKIAALKGVITKLKKTRKA